MTENDLKKLKARLPKNFLEEIRLSVLPKRSYSTGYISMVLSGKTSLNDDIIEAAILLAEKHEERMKELAMAATGKKKLDKLKFNLQN
jgi:hypothetical protein